MGKDTGPIADKLTLGAVILSLAFRYPLMRAVVLLYIVKEGYMLIMGGLMIKKDGIWRCPVVWKGMYCIHLCNDIPSSSDTRDAGYGD